MAKNKNPILTWNYNGSHVFAGAASSFAWSPTFLTKTAIRIVSLYCRAIKEPGSGAADTISLTELLFQINGVSGGNNILPFTTIDNLGGTAPDVTPGFFLHSYTGDKKHKFKNLILPVNTNVTMQIQSFDAYVLNDGAIVQLLMEWQRVNES